MVNYEIVGGLELATEKGESLRSAMVSFFNAGYKKEEIEEAARFLQIRQRQPKETPGKNNKEPKKKIEKIKKFQPKKPGRKKDIRYVQSVSNYEAPKPIKKPPKQKGPKKISNYGEKPKQGGKILIFFLILFLIVLFGVLAAVFFFRQEIADLFNKLI